MPTSPMLSQRRVVNAAAVLVLGLGATACSAGTSSDDAASAGGTVASPRAAERPPAGDAGAPQASKGGSGAVGDTTSTAARVLPADRDVVYRGSISVRVTDLGAAVRRAEDLATTAEGIVFAEQTSADPKHPRTGHADLTLRVPPTAFASTLAALGRLGKELDRQRSADDVTTQVTDVTSRVQSQRRSVERMRVLLGRADTIGEVVQVESELSRREADLESLEAQLKRLEDLTSLATIEVHLDSPRHRSSPPPEDEHLGFLSGLRGGWDAFVGVVVVALTVLGALVPFAATAALVGVPMLLLWRARRRVSRAASPTSDAS